LFQRSNGKWYVEVKRGIWRSLQTRDEKEAKRRFKDLGREALRGKLLILDRQSTITFKDYSAEYKAWVSKNKKATTHRTVEQVLTKFGTVLGDKQLANIRIKDMDIFVGHCQDLKNVPVT